VRQFKANNKLLVDSSETALVIDYWRLRLNSKKRWKGWEWRRD